MKKTQKKVFGLLGLSLVAGMTAVAATLPAPEASAATSSITDTLVVRVVGDEPEVRVTPTHNDVTYGPIVVDPIYWATVSYQDLNKLSIKLVHTDRDGNDHTYNLGTTEPDYIAGDLSKQMLLSNYGYGKYIFNAYGYGYSYEDGNEDTEGAVGYTEDFIKFTYLPVMAVENEDGSYSVATDTSSTSRVDYVYITVDGEVIKDTNGQPKKFYNGDIIPVDNLLAKPNSEPYIIGLTAYDSNGESLYNEFTYSYISDLVPDTGAPDTGGLLKTLNISNEDYLVTGLLVFFVISVVALGIIIRGRTAKTSKRRR